VHRARSDGGDDCTGEPKSPRTSGVGEASSLRAGHEPPSGRGADLEQDHPELIVEQSSTTRCEAPRHLSRVPAGQGGASLLCAHEGVQQG